MSSFVNRWALAALVLMGASVAQAATPPVTTLSFSSLLGYAKSVHVQDTVGGDLTITPVGGQYLVNILGELGVTNSLFGDYRINLNEGVLLNFDEKVSLLGWDMDDLRGGSNVFTLKVDGGAVQMISLQATQPDQPEVGRSFLLGWSGDAYLIDSLTFGAWHEPVGPLPDGGIVGVVPEPSTSALLAACMVTMGVFVRRRSA